MSTGEAAILAALLSGVIGAVSALASHYLTSRLQTSQLEQDIRQRRLELQAAFLIPVASERLSALATVHDIIQGAIEEGRLTPAQYMSLRARLFFLDEQLSADLVESMAAALRSPQESWPDRAEELRLLQRKVRDTAGLHYIDWAISRLAIEAD